MAITSRRRRSRKLAEPLPIPPRIWQRLLAFLKSGGTGQITLDTHRGTVTDGWIRERIRDDDDVEST